MKGLLCLLGSVLVLGLIGCGGDHPLPPKKDKEATIRAALAELDAADQPLAEAQKFCAVQTHNRLGSMGKPYKILVKGQPVFLCCDGCEKTALADQEKTLRTVEGLKATTGKTAAK